MANNTTQCLLDHLPDLDHRQPMIGKRASVGLALSWGSIWKLIIPLNKIHSYMRERFVQGVRSQIPGIPNSVPTIQEYIQCRMRKSCETVDKFGFGTHEEVLDDVEKTMCEICRVTQRDINTLARLVGDWVVKPFIDFTKKCGVNI